MAYQFPATQQAYGGLIMEAAKRRGVHPAFLSSMINTESGGNPLAYGPQIQRMGNLRAGGLMQLMPGTYDEVAAAQGLGANRMDPRNNIEAGTAYFAQMRDKYGNDDDALMAYNWGPGNVDRWIARGRNPAEVPEETRNYVGKIKSGAASSLYDESMSLDAASAPGNATYPQLAPGDQLPAIPGGPNINPQAQAMALQQPAPVQTASGDLLGGQTSADLLNVNDVPADDPLASVRQKARGQALLDAGAALLGASAWSPRPISMGEALGAGVKAGSAGYQGVMQQEMQDRLVQAKIAEMEDKSASLAALRSYYGLGGASDGSVTTASAPGAADYTAEERQRLQEASLSGDPKDIRETADNIRKDRAAASKAAGEMTQQQFERANYLRDDYNATTAVKDYNVITPAYNQIQKIAGKAEVSGTDDLALIYAYAKILDPGSVVREGEVQFSQQAMPGADRIIQQLKGTFDSKNMLNGDIRRDIAAQAAAIYADRKAVFDDTNARFTKMAQTYGIDPTEVVLPELQGVAQAEIAPTGYGFADTAPAQAPAPEQAAPAPEQAPAEQPPAEPQQRGAFTVEQLDAMPVGKQLVFPNGRMYLKTAQGWRELKPE